MACKHDTRLSVLPDIARWRGQTVGLYGGSFNPVHEGHFHVAEQALKRLDLDGLWMMVSPGNPLKTDTSDEMASARDRLMHASVRQPHTRRIWISDIETRLGTTYTVDTINRLRTLMPTTRFIWIMGADSMTGFHRWKNWQEITRTVPIAIFDRPGYTISGLSSRMAQTVRRYRTHHRMLLRGTRPPVWAFVSMTRHPGSATEIRRQLGHKWAADFYRLKET